MTCHTFNHDPGKFTNTDQILRSCFVNEVRCIKICHIVDIIYPQFILHCFKAQCYQGVRYHIEVKAQCDLGVRYHIEVKAQCDLGV